MRYVQFPKLNIKLFIEREAFSIFGIDVYWYGIILAFGLIMGIIASILTGKKTGIKNDTIFDLVIYGLPSSVIFARLYYVVFEFENYRDNLWDIFNLRAGGIAIYGAVIGALISTLIYSRVKKISFLKLCDTGATGLITGQMIGRWGNFVNQEAFGTNTDALWGMTGTDIVSYLENLKDAGYNVSPQMCVHPTFLYESLWNMAVLFALIYVIKKCYDFEGRVFYTYIALYGFGRFFIEGLRWDSLYLGIFRVSQIVALICVISGFILIMYGKYRKKIKNC